MKKIYGSMKDLEGVISLARNVVAAEVQARDRMSSRIDAAFEKAIDIVLNTEGRVVVGSMRKSGLIGKKIAATMASTGTPAFSVHPVRHSTVVWG